MKTYLEFKRIGPMQESIAPDGDTVITENYYIYDSKNRRDAGTGVNELLYMKNRDEPWRCIKHINIDYYYLEYREEEALCEIERFICHRPLEQWEIDELFENYKLEINEDDDWGCHLVVLINLI